MKYISLDIETTGLNPNTCQILEIGAIIEDSKDPKPFEECPKFEVLINHEFFQGEAYAIDLNKRIFEIFAHRTKLNNKQKDDYDKKHNIADDNEAAIMMFYSWVRNNYNAVFSKNTEEGNPISVIFAGKNFAGFDLPFLRNAGLLGYIKPFHRVIDPMTLFIDWKSDVTPPDLERCKERAGLDLTKVSHKAIEDAWDVIQVLRKFYKKTEI